MSDSKQLSAANAQDIEETRSIIRFISQHMQDSSFPGKLSRAVAKSLSFLENLDAQTTAALDEIYKNTSKPADEEVSKEAANG